VTGVSHPRAEDPQLVAADGQHVGPAVVVDIAGGERAELCFVDGGDVDAADRSGPEAEDDDELAFTVAADLQVGLHGTGQPSTRVTQGHSYGTTHTPEWLNSLSSAENGGPNTSLSTPLA
jgi:hypothetical protein